jgi:benzoyl-CoA reductase subunit C
MGVNVMTILEELAQIARTRPEKLKERKAKGAKLVGYTGRFVPEELIHASGAVPYLMCRGGDAEPVDATIPYLLRFMSPYYRTQIGYHLLGIDLIIPMLDLIVLQAGDVQESRVADVFDYFKLPASRLGVPSDWEKSIALGYYQKRLTILKDKLETLTGQKITDARLKKAIESVNSIRTILRKIDLLRRKQPPPIGGYDFIRLNHYSFYGDPEVLSGRLNDLYQQLQNDRSPFPAEAPRILLVGHVVAIGDYTVPKLIEASGGVIVAELLDEGMRHCAWNVATEGDLMSNLGTTYYIERTPPSVYQPSWRKRADIIRKMIKDLNIDGVVLYQLTFEEIHDMESPIIAKAVAEMKVPFLRLESSYEYSREPLGTLVTRIESFIESTKQRRSR